MSQIKTFLEETLTGLVNIGAEEYIVVSPAGVSIGGGACLGGGIPAVGIGGRMPGGACIAGGGCRPGGACMTGGGCIPRGGWSIG